MRGGRTDTPRNSFKSLLNIHHQTPLDGRRINPFAFFIEDLQSPRIIL
jgi:hypothetical protein